MLPNNRYGVIASGSKQRWVADHAERCRLILRAAGIESGKWKIGKTKLFLKEADAVRIYSHFFFHFKTISEINLS